MALVLESPDTALDHGHASVFADGPESLPEATPPAPAPELPRDELPALIREEVPWLMTCDSVAGPPK
jgi:hypothetical protein